MSLLERTNILKKASYEQHKLLESLGNPEEGDWILAERGDELLIRKFEEIRIKDNGYLEFRAYSKSGDTTYYDGMRNIDSLTFEEMFDTITEFQVAMGYNYTMMTDAEKLSYAQSCSLSLYQEVSELTDSFQFAEWKKPKADIPNIEREVLDCIFFLHHIASCFNITPSDLMKRFGAVMDNNYKRYDKGNK